jgi:hypothetical protein
MLLEAWMWKLRGIRRGFDRSGGCYASRANIPQNKTVERKTLNAVKG